MNCSTPSINWLSDTSVFAINRLEAHSDHKYYVTEEEAKLGEMALRQNLNGNWKFSFALNPSSRIKNFYEPEFDCYTWKDITVPGHIQLQGYDKLQYINTMYPWDGHSFLRPPEVSEEYNPVGSYVKYFNVNENINEENIFVSFQGVESAFYVWLNGKFVGYSEDSFTPAEFELTTYIKEGENKLAVEVYKRSTGSWLEDQDFWRFSGIFRDVYLYSIPKTHVQDIFVQTLLDNVSKYIVPQESGNHTGVRWAKVMNKNGFGIEFVCENDPFELPSVNYTVATIAGRQMGVGGDDSWGAPVHEEYIIVSSKDIHFEFIMRKCINN